MEEIIIAAAKENVKCVNTVKLVGSVVHKFRPRSNVILLTIAVKSEGVHEVEYPNVAFYGDDVADSIDQSVTVESKNYPRVRIEGMIQSYMYNTPEGRRRTRQNIVGTLITHSNTKMEQLSGHNGIGLHKAESHNDVCVLGTVVSVYPIHRRDSDQTIAAAFVLRTESNGHINFPRLICFGSQVPYALSLSAGDVVCATGFIETVNRKQSGENPAHRESVVATEIVKM